MQNARQTSSLPTRKAATVALGAPTLIALMKNAVTEVWPSIVPAVFAGEHVTAFVSYAIPAACALVIAWFIPDAPNVPTDVSPL